MFEPILAVVAIGLIGPLLASTRRAFIPVVVGEILAGAVFGHTGFDLLDPSRQPLPVFHDLGFALLMFTTGTQLKLGRLRLRDDFRRSALAFLCAGAVAIPVALGISRSLDAGSFPLFAVLLVGSSAALVLPMLIEQRIRPASIGFAVSWIAIADVLALLLMPLTIGGRGDVVSALLGDAAIVASGVVVYLVARRLSSEPLAHTLRHRSRRRGWALQLRTSLILLLGLAVVAERTSGSSLIAGFTAGIVLSQLHEPGRLAKQVAGLADGFFVPAFFVLLGASLDLRALATEPHALVLGAALAFGSVAVHAVAALVVAPDRRLISGLLASGQLGLPAAAASLGLANGVFTPAEAGAVVAAACLTLIPATLGVFFLQRSQPQTQQVVPPSPSADGEGLG